ncbi:MAG: thymidine kinase, partial [Oscillospiraceae bacterium]
EGSVRLLEIAHTVEELKTICECGKKAMINARLVDGKYVFSGAQVAIDKVDRVEYRALCPECYFRIKNKTEGK